MYYKIVNKKSQVYQKLHALRTKEHEINKKNREVVDEKIGINFQTFLGNNSQQNFRRVTQYAGFVFNEPEKVNSKIWKEYKDKPSAYVPNKRTKLGREMDAFLMNGLETSHFADVFDILGIQYGNRFVFPFVEIKGDTIILFLDEDYGIKDSNVIEITNKEFKQILEN